LSAFGKKGAVELVDTYFICFISTAAAYKTMLHGILAILAATASPQRDSLPRLDTAFVVARRIHFGSIGRFQNVWSGNESSNQGLTQFLSQSGVFLKQYGATGIATISRRGADPQQTQILWNGLPVANAMLGMPDLNTMFLFGSQEISLTDGGNASVYGSGSVGGTLQINHGPNLTSGFSVNHTASVGSFGRSSNATDLSYAKKNTWMRIQGAYTNANNNFFYRDLVNNEWEKTRMPNANTHFRNGRLQAGSVIGKTSFRGIVEWNSAERNLGRIIGSPINQGSQFDVNSRYLIESTSKLEKVSVVNRVGYTRDKIIFKDTAHHILDTSVASVKHLQSEWYFKFGHSKWMVGADLQLQQGNSNAYAGAIGRNYFAQFVSIIIPIKRWILNPGLRFEWYEKMPVWTLSSEKKIAKNYQFKCNVHTAFRRPTLNDLFWGDNYNSALKSEKGMGAETGVLYTHIQKKASMDMEVCFYGRSLKNAIVWIPDGSIWVPKNYYKGNYMGTQFKLKYNWKIKDNNFHILGSYDYVFSQIYSSAYSEAKQRIFVPKHTAFLQIIYQRFGFQVNGNVTYTGKRFTTSDNSDFMPSFWLFSSNISKTIWNKEKSSANLVFQCENISNLLYQNMPGKPMLPRNYLITLLLHFKTHK